MGMSPEKIKVAFGGHTGAAVETVNRQNYAEFVM
jgi:hypothetical protein